MKKRESEELLIEQQRTIDGLEREVKHLNNQIYTEDYNVYGKETWKMRANRHFAELNDKKQVNKILEEKLKNEREEFHHEIEKNINLDVKIQDLKNKIKGFEGLKVFMINNLNYDHRHHIEAEDYHPTTDGYTIFTISGQEIFKIKTSEITTISTKEF